MVWGLEEDVVARLKAVGGELVKCKVQFSKWELEQAVEAEEVGYIKRLG